MAVITSVELGASGRYINLGTPAALANLGDYTMLAYARPNAPQEAGLGYMFAKSPSSGAGPRMFLGSGGGSNYDLNGGTSSSTSLQPYRKSAALVWSASTWAHFAVTFDGTLNGTGYQTYIGAGADLTETAYGTTVNGTSALVDDSTYNANILNREGLGRAFVGDLAYFAIWDRVLTLTEMREAQNNGPLNVPTGLVLLWANQSDLSPSALSVSSRSTYAAGSLPPNTALGGALPGIDVGAAALGVAGYAPTISQPREIVPQLGSVVVSGSVHEISQSTSVHPGTASLVYVGLVPTVSQPISIVLESPENGTLNLASCFVTPGGTTPTITLVTRWPGENNTNGWRSMHGAASGLSGLTPTFRLVKASKDTNVAISKKPVYSYDAVTWYAFDNLTSDATYYYFSNSAAFAGDYVYFSLAKPFYHASIYPWITSIESSGYVSETATSLGANYEMGTRSATVNEQGKTIPAHPWYSFKISSGGLAPDGYAKRSVILCSGLHAAEDTGDHALVGAVNFLVSADSQAASLRDWCDIYVYPLVASAGRKGGGARGDFQAGYASIDVNRSWNDSVLETVVAHKAAWLADPATDVVTLIDFHSYFLEVAPYDETQAGTDRASWTPMITMYRAGISVTDNDLNTSATKWAYQNLGASPLTLDAEYGLYSATYTTDPAAWGADHMRALSDLAVSGYFFIPSVIDIGTASLSVAGYVPTLSQPHEVAPQAGSQFVSGYAHSLSQPREIAPQVGSAVVNGYTHDISQTASVRPGAGAIACNGQAPSISQPKTIQPGIGAYDILGLEPTIIQSAVVAPDSAAIIVTGYSASLVQGGAINLFPVTGAIVFIGYGSTIGMATEPTASAIFSIPPDRRIFTA